MTVFLYDGTYNGFLSAVFAAYARALPEQAAIQSVSVGYPVSDHVTVQTEEAHAGRVESKLFALGCAEILYKAWLSREPNIDDDMFCCIRYAIGIGKNPWAEKNVPFIKRVWDAASRVGAEVHRFQQFVRFCKVSEKPAVYAADIEPMYDILPLLGNHFSRRFASQLFIIRDLRFRKTLVWDRSSWYVTLDERILGPQLRDEGEFADMWRGYFKAVAIPWRKNKKLQAQFVPQRYRAHLTEFN